MKRKSERRLGFAADRRPDLASAIASWNNGDAYRDGSLRLLVDKGFVEHSVRPSGRGWVPTPAGIRAGLRTDHLNETREAGGRHVADFNTLADLIRHAGEEGATHVFVAGSKTEIYFPRDDGQYDEAKVFRQNGYWHLSAPSDRKAIHRLPADAAPVGEIGRRGIVRDYEAIDRRDRVIAGPFKTYGDAKDAAGPAGAVRFVPKKKAPTARETRSAHTPSPIRRRAKRR